MSKTDRFSRPRFSYNIKKLHEKAFHLGIFWNKVVYIIKGCTTNRMSPVEEKTETKPIDSEYYKWSKKINESKKVRNTCVF